MSSMRDRLRERYLARWAVAYGAGAFVAIQAMEALSEPMGLSLFVQQAALVLIVMGLPVALVLAWFHGEKGAQHVSVPEFVILSTLALVAVGAIGLVRQRALAAEASTTRLLLEEPPNSAARVWGIAVLPFEELTPPSEELRIAEAVHDQVLTHLTHVPGINPKSRTSVRALRGLPLTSRQIADTLGADYVLESTLQYFEPLVRVNSQLIDPVTDSHVWGDARDFQLTNFLELQEEVADWITLEIQQALGGPIAPAIHAEVSSQAAQDLYLNGRYLATSRTEEGLAGAIAAYTEALTIDADFGAALSALALTYALWGHYGYGGENASYATFGRALAMVDRAVELQPDLAGAHATRGYLLSKALAPADTVEASFLRALALAPGSSDAHILYAGFLAREGRFAEAIAESDRAVNLDPIAPGRDSGMGYNALAAGQLELALSASNRASVLEPGLLAPRIIRALALVLLDRAPECLDIDLGPYRAVRAICLGASGQAEAATLAVEGVLASDGPRNAALHVASFYAWDNDPASALDALARAYDDSPHGLDYRVVASGIFDPVRDDQAFQEGLEQLHQRVWNRVREARAAATS
jgi:TolB-like protein